MLAIKAFRLLASRLVIEEGDSKFTTQGMLFVGGEGAIYYPRNVVCWGRGLYLLPKECCLLGEGGPKVVIRSG